MSANSLSSMTVCANSAYGDLVLYQAQTVKTVDLTQGNCSRVPAVCSSASCQTWSGAGAEAFLANWRRNAGAQIRDGLFALGGGAP